MTLLKVRGLQRAKLIMRPLASNILVVLSVSLKSHSHLPLGTLEQIPDGPTISIFSASTARLDKLAKDSLKSLGSACRQHQDVVQQHSLCNLHELFFRVVLEEDLDRKA